MADRREYSGRRNGSLYRTGSYYQRENTLRKSRSILPYQIFVCAVLLLCLLGGWLLDAQWFADGKRQLLVQINAEDQTQQVGNMLSGILKKDGLENRTPATTSDAASLAPEEEKRSRRMYRRKNWKSCTDILNNTEKVVRRSKQLRIAWQVWEDTCRSTPSAPLQELALPITRRRKDVCFPPYRLAQNLCCR